MYLEKEINKCLEFKLVMKMYVWLLLIVQLRSKDEEINLVSVEEFYRDAPETISRSVGKTACASHFINKLFFINLAVSN
jgi:hypothetical protein